VLQLKDPIALLEHLKQCSPNEGIFLLMDFQAVIGDPLVQRLLKDVARHFKESHNSIIILSPVRSLPQGYFAARHPGLRQKPDSQSLRCPVEIPPAAPGYR
jgi:hypothetical protein